MLIGTTGVIQPRRAQGRVEQPDARRGRDGPKTHPPCEQPEPDARSGQGNGRKRGRGKSGAGAACNSPAPCTPKRGVTMSTVTKSRPCVKSERSCHLTRTEHGTTIRIDLLRGSKLESVSYHVHPLP